jgi:hypothetical protein
MSSCALGSGSSLIDRCMNADLTLREGHEGTRRTRKVQKEIQKEFFWFSFASFAEASPPSRTAKSYPDPAFTGART